MNHETTVMLGALAARVHCACGAVSPEFVNPMQAKMWRDRHLAESGIVDALVAGGGVGGGHPEDTT
jgi:hypothetical protein